jgi:hypothetical protein
MNRMKRPDGGFRASTQAHKAKHLYNREDAKKEAIKLTLEDFDEVMGVRETREVVSFDLGNPMLLEVDGDAVCYAFIHVQLSLFTDGHWHCVGLFGLCDGANWDDLEGRGVSCKVWQEDISKLRVLEFCKGARVDVISFNVDEEE